MLRLTNENYNTHSDDWPCECGILAEDHASEDDDHGYVPAEEWID